MAERTSLKDQNAPLIRAVLVAHVVALTWVAIAPSPLVSLDISTTVARLETFAPPGTIAIGLLLVTSMLALGLVPANWRDRLIHWRWRHPLPGSRAFSRIGPDCCRVRMDALAERHCPLPDDAAEQNRLFYAIYLGFQDETGVLDAHRRYLAARDIGTINAVLLVPFSSLAWLISGQRAAALCYAGALFAAYVLCAIAAQNYATRLAENVLSLASSRAPNSAKNARWLEEADED